MLLFENFNEIHKICQEYGIRNYTINTDGTIDVDGGVDLSFRELTKLPLKFRNVGGHFNCAANNLTTLEGAPKLVSGYFNCSYNKLTTLVGAPQSVGGHFYCYNNPFAVIRKMFPNDKEFFNANNYWDFFAGGNKIRKLRFKEELLDYNIELPESIKGYEYI
jgi:hypothetical protein